MSDMLPDTLTPEQAQSLGFIPKASPSHGADMLPDVLTPDQAARLGLIDHSHADVSPESRRIRGGGDMRPEPKTDDELGIDRGPQYGQLDSRPTFGKDAPGTEAYRMHHAGDEMNDPGAQILTGGAMAAPLAAVAGAAAPAALAPMVSGAVAGGTQAAMTEQNPVLGAALGALPGIPKALGAADRAVGEAALARATDPARTAGAGPIATKVGKYAGKAVGGAVGAHAGGPLGLAVGQNYGGKIGMRVADSLASVGDKATGALARRYLAREGASNMVQLPTTLAPLEPKPFEPPSSLPNGAFGTPFYDDFGNVVTDAKAANQMVNHATVGGKTGVLPERSFVESAIGRLKNGTGLAEAVKAAEEEPGLREAVKRDAKKFRAESSPDVEAQPETDLAATMQRSIDILEKLKAAKSAGNLTDAMVQDAVDAGVTPALIKKVTGRMKNGEPLNKAVSGASGEVSSGAMSSAEDAKVGPVGAPSDKAPVISMDPREIRSVHPAEDSSKTEAIASSMRKNGWIGEPILVVDDQAWTGSHRLAAARKAGIPVEVYLWNPSETEREALRGEVGRHFAPRDQESALQTMENLSEDGEPIDQEALRIYRAESAKKGR